MNTTQKNDNKRWVLVATILGSSIAFIVSSVENVALPAIQKDFGASTPQLQWVINAYLLFLGALVLTGGSAGDLFGRKRMFALGITIFTAASIWCWGAADITQLIVARGLQGIGGALQVPNSLAIISATFEGKERGKAIGTWAAFSALTTGLGPVLGGWLVDEFSWRWTFLIIVPLALVTLAITLWRVPESREEDSRGLDLPGMILATLGLGATTYGLIASSERGWGHPLVLTTVIGGVVILIAFLWWESRSPHPMMPLRLFRSSSFTGANLITLVLYFGFSGVLFFIPFNMIQVQGYSATQAGASFLPFSVPMGLLSRWAGGLADKMGARFLLVAGSITVAIGIGLLALPGIGGSYWTTFFLPFLILGIGMSLSVAPLTTVVMTSVDEHHVGTASGANNTVARVAGLLAVAILGVIVLGIFSSNLEGRLDNITPALSSSIKEKIVQQRTELAEIHIPDELAAGTRQEIKQEIDLAFVDSFRIAMLLSALCAIASAVIARTMIEGKPKTDEEKASG